MNKKILHIAHCDKFIPPFIEFVKENFDFSQHEYLLTSGMSDKNLSNYPNVYLAKSGHIESLRYYLKTLVAMHRSSKVILHGLFDIKLITLFFFTPWLLKKCYWVIWGGDFYIHNVPRKDWRWKTKEFLRRFTVKRIGHFVTLIKGEYDLARNWYGATGQHHECFTYTSNMYKGTEVTNSNGSCINILLGNSADPSNNHEKILEALQVFTHMQIKVYCPLSYGPTEHAKKIEKKGKELLGNNFVPLLSFMKHDEYMDFLGKIDIAIFAHKRQQAMGNTITLLGMGKKVFIRSDVTQWDFLNSIGVKIYDSREINLERLDTETACTNSKIISEYFSERNLVRQLSRVFTTE